MYEKEVLSVVSCLMYQSREGRKNFDGRKILSLHGTRPTNSQGEQILAIFGSERTVFDFLPPILE